MRALPERVREFCPSELRKFKARSRPWLAQIYFHDSSVHYEVWSLGQRLSIHPQGSLEIGLHFESRNRALNQSFLDGFVRYFVEVKDELGPEWEQRLAASALSYQNNMRRFRDGLKPL